MSARQGSLSASATVGLYQVDLDLTSPQYASKIENSREQDESEELFRLHQARTY